MLSVALIWIYVLTISYVLGCAVSRWSESFFGYRIMYTPSILFAGFVVETVYAQIFSIFAGVSLGANVVLICICVLYLAFPNHWADFRLRLSKIKEAKHKWSYLVLFVLMAYGASRGIIHYDTSLYHAQAIEWIEKYGLVKGLGNLHCRLAYNSAAFPLSALFSLHFITGQSFHVMAGMFAFVLSLEALKIVEIKKRGRLALSDYGRIMAIYYLFNIFDEMVSPASDYFMVLTAFFIILRFLTLLEEKVTEQTPYGLLSLLGVYLITLKLSAALILLLTIWPACFLIQQKKGRQIAIFIGSGIAIAIPYFIRNVFISGWLVYPFTSIDLFSVDWKIPKEIASYDAKEIQVYGRGYADVSRFYEPVTTWIGTWFRNQSVLDRLFIFLAISGIFIWTVFKVFQIVSCIKSKMHAIDARGEKNAQGEARMQYGHWGIALVEATCALSFLFWVLTSPLIRYGCVYVWLTAILLWGDIAECLITRFPNLKRVVYLGLILFGTYKVLMFGKEFMTGFQNQYWVCQKDYDSFEVEEINVDGLIFYKPVLGDQTGYQAFPSMPYETQFELRGDTIEDGFRAITFQ